LDLAQRNPVLHGLGYGPGGFKAPGRVESAAVVNQPSTMPSFATGTPSRGPATAARARARHHGQLRCVHSVTETPGESPRARMVHATGPADLDPIYNGRYSRNSSAGPARDATVLPGDFD